MRSRTVAVALAAALVFAACGSGSEQGDGVADGSAGVVLPTPADGPVPELAVAPASAANPLPEIAVRRINGDGGWVQFKNELPAETPLLVWFWAPH